MNKTDHLAARSWWHEVKADLRPVAGRWAQAWRIAVACALMTLISMTYGIPAAVLSCYVLFFVMKSDAAESMVMAVALVVLVSLVVFALVGLVNVTIGSPAARLAVIAGVSVVFLFLGNASVLGPLGGIIALVIAFVMTLLVYVPVGELATRAILYAWLMTAAPMGLLILFSLAFGRKPKDVLSAEIRARLELAAQGVENTVSINALKQELALGIETQQKRLKWLALFHLAPKNTQQYLGIAIIESYRLLLQAYLYRVHGPQECTPKELAAACRALADGMQNIDKGVVKITAVFDAQRLSDFVMPAEKPSFFVNDAFTNPTYQRTALKATGAAVLCYLIYSGVQWEGIHTAMITCYVATLGSTGETVNKLLLRIIGALVGASLGLFMLFVIMPIITSIGALMIAVFLVCLLAAWVYLGSERVSYAGLQIAFAFLLISLHGFGPSIDVSTASDRIIGILLGNVMMYIAFTQIWPQSVMRTVEKQLAELEELLQELSAAASQSSKVVFVAQLAKLAQELHETNYNFSLVALEPKTLRPAPAALEQYQLQLAQVAQRFEQMAFKVAAAPS